MLGRRSLPASMQIIALYDIDEGQMVRDFVQITLLEVRLNYQWPNANKRHVPRLLVQSQPCSGWSLTHPNEQRGQRS